MHPHGIHPTRFGSSLANKALHRAASPDLSRGGVTVSTPMPATCVGGFGVTNIDVVEVEGPSAQVAGVDGGESTCLPFRSELARRARLPDRHPHARRYLFIVTSRLQLPPANRTIRTVISSLGARSRSRSSSRSFSLNNVVRWTGAIYAAPLVAKWESFGTPCCMLGFEVSCRCFAELSPSPIRDSLQACSFTLLPGEHQSRPSDPEKLPLPSWPCWIAVPGPSRLGRRAIRGKIDQTGQTVCTSPQPTLAMAN